MTDQSFNKTQDVPQSLLPFTAFNHQALQQAQATNLRWCEAWSRTLPSVAGVPIGPALVFDLIQLINRAEIEAILGPTPDFAAIQEEVKKRMEAIPKELEKFEKAQAMPLTPYIGKGKRKRLRKPVK